MGRSLTGRERKCIPGGDGKGKNPNPKSQAGHSGDCEEGRTAWKEGRIWGGSGRGEKLESYIGTSLPGALNAKSLEFLHSY